MYGGDLLHHSLPCLIPETWHLGSDLVTTQTPLSQMKETMFRSQSDCEMCRRPGGQATTSQPCSTKVGPGLTPEEEEAKWKQFYDRYAKRPEPNPTVNVSFMILL